jgi:type VI secretion system protein ImpJ
MGRKNKVVWSEGMFLQPQHFQQHDRYMENAIHGRSSGLTLFDWGFVNVKIDQQQLALGKFSLLECRGIFSDGTPFNLPEDDVLPLPIDIVSGVQNSIVYLALPVIRNEAVEYDSDEEIELLARYHAKEFEVKDSYIGSGTRNVVHVGHLQTRMVKEDEDRSSYVYVGIAKILECRTDKTIVLDEGYIAPMLNCATSAVLQGYVEEILGLIKTRGEALAHLVTSGGTGGVADVADFMLLQLVNRYEPLYRHFSSVDGLHPELLYRHVVQLAGELATFIDKTKRCVMFEQYKHDALAETFIPVMDVIRQYLNMVLEQNAIPIPLSGPKFGVYAGKIPDQNLIDHAVFVLAVKADVAPEMISNYFSPQTKIGPVEKIQQLVRSALPGITIHALPVAPRQLPYHAGFAYFELNKTNEMWQQLKSSGGIAVQIGGEFPGLELEMWAIKNG